MSKDFYIYYNVEHLTKGNTALWRLWKRLELLSERMRRNNQIKSKCSMTVYWTSHFLPKQPTIYTQTYYYEPADFRVNLVAFIPRECGTEKQK